MHNTSKENKTLEKPSCGGSIRQRPDGRFEGRICINGKRKSVYDKSYAECIKKIEQLFKEAERMKMNSNTDSLFEYASKWVVEYKLDYIEPSSYDRLDTMIRTQISQSDLADYNFDKITASQIKEFLINLISSEDQGGKGYSYSSMKRVYELLKDMYSFAYHNNEIDRNPMENVRLPRRSLCTKQVKETFSLTPDEIISLKAACLEKNEHNSLYKYRYGLIFMLMLNTGVRVGEMLALEWGDIDFHKGYIRINKAVQSNVINRSGKGNKRTYNVTAPKTKNGKRLIPLNDEILFLLDAIKMDNCIRKIETDLVCSSSTGGYATARNLQRSLENIVKNSDIGKHLWLHLLRHTFGSELIRNGIDISVVSKLMGHGNIYITYTKYIHVLQEDMVMAMNMTSISR